MYRLAYAQRQLPFPPQSTIFPGLRGSVPTRIELPPCLLDSCRVIFPTLDFSRIVFYLGIPRGVSGASGFTMCSGGPGADIRIYLKTFDPCSTATFVLVAHELVHALQIQGMVGGGRIPGSWVSYYMSHTLRGGGRGGGRTNDLELEAYNFTNGRSGGEHGMLRDFVDAHLGGAAPCSRIGSRSPTPKIVRGQSYAEALATAGTPTKTTSSVGHTWYSLLTWPITILAGAFSVFGFSSNGGALGSLGGIAAGGIAGGVVGGLRRGPIGAVLGVLTTACAGGIAGGAIGWSITPWRCRAALQAFCRRTPRR